MSKKTNDITPKSGKKLNFFFRHIDLTIIVITACLLAFTNISLYLFSKSQVEKSAKAIALGKIEHIDSHISDLMERIKITTNLTLDMVEDNIDHPESMLDITRNVVENDTCVMGCAIVFRPDFYPKYGKYFEPYTFHKFPENPDSLESIIINDHDYTSNEIYIKSIDTDSALWSDPYFGKTSGLNIISYSQPFHDKEGKFAGFILADVRIEWINGIMKNALPYPSAFSIIAEPISKKLFISSAESDEQLLTDKIINNLKPNMSGSFTIESASSSSRMVVYAPISSTNWSMAISIANRDLLGDLRTTTVILVLLNALILLLLGLILNRGVKSARRRRLDREHAQIIRNELKIANKIQTHLLPKEFPVRDDVDIYGLVTPAKEVGGDLFDYRIRDEKLFFCVGDVSGKGTPASLLMSVTISYFRAIISRESRPAKIMEWINSMAVRGNEEYMFVTLFIGVLDLPTGRLRYCNAGHDAPLIIDENVVTLDVEANLPVGVLENFKYVEQQTTIPSSATILLYTDGVTEAVNATNNLYGIDLLKRICSNASTPKELVDNIGNDIRQFANGTEQSDDITMLAIHFILNDDVDGEELHAELDADINQITRLETLCNDIRDRFGIDQQIATHLNVALEEAVSNIIIYGFKNKPDTSGHISVSARKAANKITIKIDDNAPAFDPTSHETPDTTLDADDRPIGGLGIYLVRQIMDTVNYECTDGHNILTITKTI